MDQESPGITSEEPDYEFDTPSPAYSDADRACSPNFSPGNSPVTKDSTPHGVPQKAEPPSTNTEERASCNPAQKLVSDSIAAEVNAKAHQGQVSQAHIHSITSFMTDLSDQTPKPQLTPATNQTVNGQPDGPEPFSPSKHFKRQTILSRLKIAKINEKSSKEKTLEDVQEESLERGKDIWRAWAYLKKILERHELSIRKRWNKISSDKRRQILQKVWPKMEMCSSPHMIAYRDEPPAQRTKATKYRDAYLFPHINLHALSNNRKSLLIFLNKRGRCDPSLFARTDHHHMKSGDYALYFPCRMKVYKSNRTTCACSTAGFARSN
jgi:hypothetical protein